MGWFPERLPVSSSPTDWYWTFHALSRAADMAVHPSELAACITSPDLVYPQKGEYAGREARVAGRILITVDPVEHKVLTVLWHRAEGRD
jgi:hypothetical protein